MPDKKEFQEGIHYYLDCRHCPFDPKHKKGNQIVSEKFGNLKESH